MKGPGSRSSRAEQRVESGSDCGRPMSDADSAEVEPRGADIEESGRAVAGPLFATHPVDRQSDRHGIDEHLNLNETKQINVRLHQRELKVKTAYY